MSSGSVDGLGAERLGDEGPGDETVGAESPAPTGVDRLRLRSFIGLSLGLVGPRANLAVSGVLLTLLVSSRVSSAVAITFALTANRLVGWVAYPLLGRASDRTRSRGGAAGARTWRPGYCRHGRVHVGLHAGARASGCSCCSSCW